MSRPTVAKLYSDANGCQMSAALGFEVTQVKALQKDEGDEQGQNNREKRKERLAFPVVLNL